jgi:hypothetical protein
MSDQDITQQSDQIQSIIMKELGLEGIPDEQQKELISKMGEVILKKIFLETMDRLGDEDQEAFQKLLETEPTEEQVREFLLEKIPDYDQMTEKIAKDFMQEMKDEVQV